MNAGSYSCFMDGLDNAAIEESKQPKARRQGKLAETN